MTINVFAREENIIAYVSDKKISWLGPHIAAATATASVVLAIENNKNSSPPTHRTALRTQDCSATVFFRFFRHPFLVRYR